MANRIRPSRSRSRRGAHVVRLYGIDAGVKVDKLLFTTDPNPARLLLPPDGVEDHLFYRLSTHKAVPQGNRI